MPSFLLQVTRLGFGGLGAVAPGLAGSLAFSLFCRTPSRRPAGAKARQTFAEGEARLAGAERIAIGTNKGEVMTYRLKGAPAARRVLVVHGWGSRAEYLSALAAGLHEVGLEVVVLDLPGHGRSYGRTLDMRMAAEAIAATEAQLGPFDAAVGHSFGGAALMTAAGGIFPGAGHIVAPKLAVIGAPSEIIEVFRDFSAMLRLSPVVQHRLVAHAERVAGIPLRDFDTIDVARRLGRPMLVVHAEDDKEVGAHHARRYDGLGDHVRLLWANGHGHRRIVSAPEVIEAVAGFVLDEDAGDMPGTVSVGGRLS
ncbi:alpha/beta fold hydrolase [Pseudomonas sp. R2.Fl]|nr:alpha/beta fold hydrolase [Pseudomonas sp. R2.Fl]